jgi:competence protein ComEC
VVLTPAFQRWLPGRWQEVPAARWISGSCITSLAATLATLPVLLYHFGQTSFAGVVLNLVAIPLTGATLAAGLALAFTGLAPFGAAADFFANMLLGTATLGDAVLGWATFSTYVDSMWVILTMAVLLLMVVHWPRPRLRWRLGLVALVLCTGIVWGNLAHRVHPPALRVVFFDVGQSDAALVTLPNGRHLLIDAGLRSAYQDAGARTVVPHLHRFGIRRLDAVVVSHPHSDHLGGLNSILRSVPVGRVLHNGAEYDSDLYRENRALMDSLHVPSRAVHAGDTLDLAPHVRIQVLSPAANVPYPADVNEASVVLRIAYGGTSFLFLGDAGLQAEQEMLAHYGPLLPGEVAKVGHHGSLTGSGPAFVERVASDKPTIALVSAGLNNVYGLPKEEVVLRWREQGADVRITAHTGAVWLGSDGARLWENPWRAGRGRRLRVYVERDRDVVE